MSKQTNKIFYSFRLFIDRENPRGRSAEMNLYNLCEEYLRDYYEIELIDISQNPQRAEEAGIFAVPCLLVQSPFSSQRIIGDLSTAHHFFQALAYEIDAVNMRNEAKTMLEDARNFMDRLRKPRAQ